MNRVAVTPVSMELLDDLYVPGYYIACNDWHLLIMFLAMVWYRAIRWSDIGSDRQPPVISAGQFICILYYKPMNVNGDWKSKGVPSSSRTLQSSSWR